MASIMKMIMAIKYFISEYFTATYVPTQTGKVVGLSGVAKVIMIVKFVLMLKYSGKIEPQSSKIKVTAEKVGNRCSAPFLIISRI
jgi:hypothetical protein